jgi:hypothetical protein
MNPLLARIAREPNFRSILFMNIKTLSFSVLLALMMFPVICRAQPIVVKETNTPIALHYERILKDYIAFITPKINTKENLIAVSKKYFEKLMYRVVTISIEKTTEPKFSKSWKKPNSKLAVLPRMICYLSSDSATLQLYDQGDDYILIKNHMDDISITPGLFITVGITHQWE